MIAPKHGIIWKRNEPTCWYCGAGMKCPHCGVKIESCGSHCPKCGGQYVQDPPQSKDPDDRRP